MKQILDRDALTAKDCLAQITGLRLITSMAINWPVAMFQSTSRVDKKAQHATPPTYVALLSAAAARPARRGV